MSDAASLRRQTVRTTVRCLAYAAAALAVYSLNPRVDAASLGVVARVAVSVVGLGALLVLQLTVVTRSDRPLARALEGLVLVVSLLLVVFAGTYLAMSAGDESAFSEPLDHVGALYFALTTMTTIGYGDIAPHSDPARIVVMVQMVVNVLVLGIFARALLARAKDRAGA